jgi:hypothetical protein
VLLHDHVSIWTVTVDAGEERELDLGAGPQVIADLDPAGGVRVHSGGPLTLTGAGTWFVADLGYVHHLDSLLDGRR